MYKTKEDEKVFYTAPNFNSTFEGWVKEKETIHLGGLMGIHIVNIGSNFIVARLFPIGINKQILIGNGKTLGNFWIKLLDIKEGKAKIFVCFKYFAWESKINELIKKDGKIKLKDMMKLSRIHSNELEGLRGMCQGGYEAATIYKIPKNYTNFLSVLWFAADQCSSLFIPVHICSLDIYDPYENGEAHEVALQLLEKYGHGNLTSIFDKFENDFINETNSAEEKAARLLKEGKKEEATRILTLLDIYIQMKAFSIEKSLLNMSYFNIYNQILYGLKTGCQSNSNFGIYFGNPIIHKILNLFPI